MSEDCAFCSIVAGEEEASFVYEDERVLAFIDPRQFHAGHVLVIPRRHVPDIRHLDPTDATPLLAAVAAVSRAVDAAFPSDCLSVWHSAGRAAHQEIPHLHIHVHPRLLGDDMLRIYPSHPDEPSRDVLAQRALKIRGYVDAE